MIDGEIHNWSLPWQPNNEEIIDRPGSLKPSYDRFWCFSTDYIREVMHSNSVVTLYYTFKDIPHYHATYPYDRMHKDGGMDFLFFWYFKFFFFCQMHSNILPVIYESHVTYITINIY